MVRAKFYCTNVAVEGDTAQISLMAVADGSEREQDILQVHALWINRTGSCESRSGGRVQERQELLRGLHRSGLGFAKLFRRRSCRSQSHVSSIAAVIVAIVMRLCVLLRAPGRN